MRMKFASFRDVIDLWPSREAMAHEVYKVRRNKRRRHPPVRSWYGRDAIPSWWLEPVVIAAERAGFEGVTLANLTALYKSRHPKET